MFYNPWTRKYDSPVNYNQPAKGIIAECCSVNVHKLCNLLHISEMDIIEDILTRAYERAIATIKKWDTKYPIYNHCWEAVHSVYPSVINRKKHTESIDSYENILNPLPLYNNGPEKNSEEDDYYEMVELAKEYGIQPYYNSFNEYHNEMLRSNVRRRLEKHRNRNA